MEVHAWNVSEDEGNGKVKGPEVGISTLTSTGISMEMMADLRLTDWDCGLTFTPVEYWHF